MTENTICPICGGYIGNAILYATLTTGAASTPAIIFCPGHTTNIASNSHVMLSGDFEDPKTWLMKDTSYNKEMTLVPSAATQQQETLWQIVQAVAEGATLAEDMMGGTDCLFCTGELGYSGNFHHTPECIVTKARELVEWRKTQPRIAVNITKPEVPRD